MKIRKFSGAGQVTEDIDSPSRQAAMAKMLAEANNPEAIGTTSPKFKDTDEFMASQRAAAEQRGENILKGMRDAEAKPPIVTMDQVKKAGFSNLRDYLNDKQKLTRRKEKNPTLGEGIDAVAQARADTVDYGEVLQSRETGRSRGSVSENKKTGKPSNAGQKAKRMPGPFSGMAKGGSVSSRADGIAQRGKTRGRMC